MTRLSTLVLRHKRLVVLFWLAVTAAGLAVSPTLSSRLSQQFTLPGQPAYQANLAILRSYGNGGSTLPLVAIVTAPRGSRIDAPAARRALGHAFARVAGTPGVRVVSYASTGNPRLVSPDGRTGYGLVFPPPSAQLEVRDPRVAPQVAGALRHGLPRSWSVQVTGVDELAAGGDTNGTAPGVLAEALLGALGALAVLAFVFGSLLVLVPLLIAAVAILVTFLLILGLAELTEVSVLVQFLVALIGLGVAIDYSLLLVTRWREELAHGQQDEPAARHAMATAGRAVLTSGGTVAVGLVALALLPVPLLRGIGLAGMLIPLVTVLVTVTLLPVLLVTAGRWLDWPRRRNQAHASRGWSAWARGVVRARWLAALAALAILVALGIAAFGLKLGTPRADALATTGPAHEGLVALEQAGLPTGILTPIEVLVPTGTDPTQVAGRLGSLPGVHAAVAPDEPAWRRGGSDLVSVQPLAEASIPAGKQTINRVRQAAAAIPGVQVGGSGPFDVDFAGAVYGRFPLLVAVIAAVTFVLLARAFRSLLLPAKAVLLNLLSVGAIYGVLVLVWQDGHGSGLWGIPATGSTQTFIPLTVFAFLYGAVHGLRGLHPGQDARDPRPHRLDHHRDRGGHRAHRPAGHQRRADPVRRLRRAGQRTGGQPQGVRHRPWRRHLAGRHRGPLPAGTGPGQPVRPLELVAARLGRPTPGRAAVPRPTRTSSQPAARRRAPACPHLAARLGHAPKPAYGGLPQLIGSSVDGQRAAAVAGRPQRRHPPAQRVPNHGRPVQPQPLDRGGHIIDHQLPCPRGDRGVAVATQVHRDAPIAQRRQAVGHLVPVTAGAPTAVQQHHLHPRTAMVDDLQRHHARADDQLPHRDVLAVAEPGRPPRAQRAGRCAQPTRRRGPSASHFPLLTIAIGRSGVGTRRPAAGFPGSVGCHARPRR
jgi:RND superfamily putative drug exporter